MANKLPPDRIIKGLMVKIKECQEAFKRLEVMRDGDSNVFTRIRIGLELARPIIEEAACQAHNGLCEKDGIPCENQTQVMKAKDSFVNLPGWEELPNWRRLAGYS